jgi:hypothetical protein
MDGVDLISRRKKLDTGITAVPDGDQTRRSAGQT